MTSQQLETLIYALEQRGFKLEADLDNLPHFAYNSVKDIQDKLILVKSACVVCIGNSLVSDALRPSVTVVALKQKTVKAPKVIEQTTGVTEYLTPVKTKRRFASKDFKLNTERTLSFLAELGYNHI